MISRKKKEEIFGRFTGRVIHGRLGRILSRPIELNRWRAPTTVAEPFATRFRRA